jgi:transposase-like protein
MQTCIVHLIRSALRFVSWTDRKTIAADLKPLYNAENEAAALDALEQLETKLASKHPSVARTFRNRWEHACMSQVTQKF